MTTTTPRVSELWRYPAKSMLGERLERVDVDALGVVGDRGWATRDLERGGIRGAKKIGSLMAQSARYVTEPDGSSIPHVELALSDGSTVRSDDPTVHDALSAALAHPVRLEPLAPADDLEHYRRGDPDSEDILEELRGVFGRNEDEPLPDLSMFPPEILEFESPPGTYYDVAPLMLMTTTSLESLARIHGVDALDVRRFRPSLLVDPGEGFDGHADPFPEQSWLGRRIEIGSSVLEVTTPCPRCVMVTRGFDTVEQDRSLMRTIVREADQNLGVYANVVTPGSISLDDAVLVGEMAPGGPV